jgi:UDP-N-acetylglucosamine diphosphorylase/glucosamine-1-phosphate N-acetyltransferase
MPIVLFDNISRNKLYPFTHTRAVGTIRSGIFTPQERWEHLAGEAVQIQTTKLLQPLYGAPTISSNTLWIDASLVLNHHLIEQIKSLQNGECIYDTTGFIAGIGSTNVIHDYSNSKPLEDQKRFAYTSDLIVGNDAQFRFDFEIITAGKKSAPIPDTCSATNKEYIFIEENATLLHCHLNASTGPIYIADGAEIQEGSSIRGPFYLGKDACVKMNTVVYGATTIGPKCIIGGEVKNSILFGYSNKAHHGYLGDSVIGEWCNLGAGTSNSNVKNTGGRISVWDESSNTKRYVGNKMGVCMGDYVKTAINTSITTGATIGVGANVFCAGLTPNFIHHFSWGTENTNYQIDKLIEDTACWKAFKNEAFLDIEKQLIRVIFESLTINRSK